MAKNNLKNAYIGLSASNTHKLESILNAAARLIGAIRKFAHISGYIRGTLHWLPIQQRVNFKILSLMRNCLVGVTPSYLLRSFCTFVSSLPLCGLRPVALWLSLACILLRPTLGALPVLAHQLGTLFPQSVRLELLTLSPSQFRRRLKTFLYPDAGTDAGRERC